MLFNLSRLILLKVTAYAVEAVRAAVVEAAVVEAVSIVILVLQSSTIAL